MTNRKNYNPNSKEEVFNALREQILAAQLKVVLDDRQNRESSPDVVKLAGLKLPPIIKH